MGTGYFPVPCVRGKNTGSTKFGQAYPNNTE